MPVSPIRQSSTNNRASAYSAAGGEHDNYIPSCAACQSSWRLRLAKPFLFAIRFPFWLWSYALLLEGCSSPERPSKGYRKKPLKYGLSSRILIFQLTPCLRRGLLEDNMNFACNDNILNVSKIEFQNGLFQIFVPTRSSQTLGKKKGRLKAGHTAADSSTNLRMYFVVCAVADFP